jgi:hypothetical protein
MSNPTLEGMKTLCTTVDLANIGFNGFEKETEVYEFYDNISTKDLKVIYKEYYGQPAPG